MKRHFLPVFLAAISLVACKKEEPKTEETPVVTEDLVVAEEVVNETPPDSAAVMKAWNDYMTPSKAHEMLAKDTGIWDADMTFWDPNNPEPQKATSQAEYKMILDGKYQEGKFTGKMWGMDFEGRGLTAFDNAAQEYIATWIDNFGTGLLVTRGAYDENSKTLTMHGNMVDPVTKKEKKVKEVITYIDEDHQKMEMYDLKDNGTEFKTMEILSKRRK
ncbi:DUF1579 domain-containing protein [Flavobacterium chuncheonense]|uniref:DUF1579 domain-containing protein n=1 Tax=Flavobacterium chuncheonense TaxID=2026653 RepID=A0ABW5YJM2_9FLAO